MFVATKKKKKCCDKHTFVAKKKEKRRVCGDKSRLVATKYFSLQNYVYRDRGVFFFPFFGGGVGWGWGCGGMGWGQWSGGGGGGGAAGGRRVVRVMGSTRDMLSSTVKEPMRETSSHASR